MRRDSSTLTSGIAWGVLAALCWGASTTLARFGIAAGLSPSDLILLRFGTSGIVLMPLFLRNRSLAMKELGWRRSLAFTAAAGPIYGFLVAEGFRFAPFAHGALLFPVSTTLTAILFGAVALAEPFRLRGLVGIVILLAGLALSLRDVTSHVTGPIWLGDAMFITAGMLFGLYGFLLRRWRIEALRATTVVAVLSMLICVGFYVATWAGSGLSSAPVAQIAIQVLGQGLCAGIIATLAFSKATHALGASRSGLFAAIVPVGALLTSVPLLHETVTALQLAGFLLVTLGLVLSLTTANVKTQKSL